MKKIEMEESCFETVNERYKEAEKEVIDFCEEKQNFLWRIQHFSQFTGCCLWSLIIKNTLISHLKTENFVKIKTQK